MNRHRSIKSIFGEALAQHTIDRSAFLEQACDGDEDKKSTIQRLIEAHRRQGNFMEKAPRPRDIGPCQVLLEVGSGPSGTAYLGSRGDDPAKPLVMIFVMHKRWEDTGGLRGFAEQSEIAAGMELGSLEDGRGYLIWKRSHDALAHGLRKVGSLLFTIGDLKGALTPLLMSVQMLDQLAAEAAWELTGDDRRPDALRDLGAIYSTLAGREALNLEFRQELWERARNCYRRSLDLSLERRGGNALPEEIDFESLVGPEIARCEAELDRLEDSGVLPLQPEVESPTQTGAKAAVAGDSIH
jgi:hypothetical protein